MIIDFRSDSEIMLLRSLSVECMHMVYVDWWWEEGLVCSRHAHLYMSYNQGKGGVKGCDKNDGADTSIYDRQSVIRPNYSNERSAP